MGIRKIIESDPFYQQRPECFKGVIRGESERHVYHKAVLCGKEYCPTCGKKDSWIHRRRVNRWMQKAIFFDSVGYLTITLPKHIRFLAKSKKFLQDVRTYWRRKLVRESKLHPALNKIDRGFMRWHYAGECRICKGKKGTVETCNECGGTGNGKEFHPHLNILFEGKNIPKSILSRWRKEWLRRLNEIVKEYAGKYADQIRCSRIVIHYQYWYVSNQKTIGGGIHDLKELIQTIRHKVNYITRPTWNNPEAIKDLSITFGTVYKFQTSSTYGAPKLIRPDQNPTEFQARMSLFYTEDELSAAQRLQRIKLGIMARGESPHDRTPIRWTKYEAIKNSDYSESEIIDYLPGGIFVSKKLPPLIAQILRKRKLAILGNGNSASEIQVFREHPSLIGITDSG